jgi:ParB-like chromosome segregation protein Spo0J
MTTELQEKPAAKNTPAELVKKIPLGYVRVPEARIRKDLGDLEDLKKSLREIGLTVPISVTPDFILVAGQRRLEAAKELGWSEIDVCTIEYGELDRQLAEIDENLRRKDLEPLERAFAEKRRKELLIAKYGKFSHAEKAQAQSRKRGKFTVGHDDRSFPLETNGEKTSSENASSEKKPDLNPTPVSHAAGAISETALAKERGVSKKKESGDVRAAEYAERYPALAGLTKKLGAIRDLGKLADEKKLTDSQLEQSVKKVRDEHIPALLAASLVRLGEKSEKGAADVLQAWKEKKVDADAAVRMADGILFNITRPHMYPGEPTAQDMGDVLEVPRTYSVKVVRLSFINALEDAAKKEGLTPEKFIAVTMLLKLARDGQLSNGVAEELERQYRGEQ